MKSRKIIYAPARTKLVSSIAKKVISRILFPPILLWDAAKWAVNSLTNEWVSHLVLPAQTRDVKDKFFLMEVEKKLGEIDKSKKLKRKRYFVSTFRNESKLDTLEIKHQENENRLRRDKKYIINFIGNNMLYEDMIDIMQADAEKLKCHVIGFNIRNAGESEGKLTKERDLITDGIAQVQRLLEKDGIRPENITLKGSELGATVATKVARHFHKRDQKINVFNVSGFSTVTNKYVGKIRQLGANSNTGHQETIGGKILGWFAKPFIKLFLVLSQWEMDAASAYNELPDTHKEYMVVRSSKNTRKNDSHVKDNSVITHYASLHAALKEERTKKKAELDELASSLRNANTQILIKNNLDQAQKNIAEARAHLRERKMQTAFSNDEGHGAPMDTLRDRYKGNTADHFFHQFFTRGQNDQHQKTAASTTKLSGKQARR